MNIFKKTLKEKHESERNAGVKNSWTKTAVISARRTIE